jgi:hypothetical protein
MIKEIYIYRDPINTFGYELQNCQANNMSRTYNYFNS